jgi:hypothetical protein
MESIASPRAAPSTTAVLRQQMRLLWLSRRALVPLLLLVGILLVFELLTLRFDGFTWSLAEGTTFLIVLLTGAAWPLVVWRDEAPAQRAYHWSMPVNMALHDLVRVAGGALLLCGAIAAFVAGAVAAAALRGAAAGAVPSMPLVLAYATAPLTVYLLVSALAVALNRPMEWLLLLYFGSVLLAFVGAALNISVVADVGHFVVSGPAGLGTALTGGMQVAAAGSAVDGGLTLGRWSLTVTLWLGVAAAVVTGAALVRHGHLAR